MSWSVSYTGHPGPAKESLAEQFASSRARTKHIPHEYAAVGIAETAINNQLDFLIANRPDMQVYVAAHGSSGIAPEDAIWKTYSQAGMSVTEYIPPTE